MSSGSISEVESEQKSERANNRSMTMVVYFTAAILLVFDQVTKVAADHWLRPIGSIPLAGSWISLTWATNTGGAFGVLASSPRFLTVISAIVAVGLVLMAPRLSDSRMLGMSVALLLGGALGNLMDRLRLGYVIDFIDLHFWPIFNIADIAITIGAGLLIIAMILGHPHPPDHEQESD